MGYKRGLKLWSINTDAYYNEAKRLYAEGVFDYIELYVVPNSLDTLAKWKELHYPLRHCVPLPPKGAEHYSPDLFPYLRHCVPLPPKEAEHYSPDLFPQNNNTFIGKKTYAPYMKEFARKLRKNMTKQEVIFWQQIRKNKLGARFRRQHLINDKYIADFYCHEKRLIIEIDGGQHCNSFKDKQRTFYLEKYGYRIVRFWNNEINENLQGCVEFLKQELNTNLPPLGEVARSAVGMEINPDNTNLPPLGEVARSAVGGIPFIIHAPHFAHGFNLAKRDKQDTNYEIYKEVKQFADELNAQYIIFHGGIDGDIRETAVQLALFNEQRALIENKPYIALPNKMGGEFCRGYNQEEIRLVTEIAQCGFCFDFGHAICAANSLGVNVYKYCKEFLQLRPKMYHLTDLNDINSPYDSHLHLGTGELDFGQIFNMIPDDSFVTFETNKDSKIDLNDFAEDMEWLKGYSIS